MAKKTEYLTVTIEMINWMQALMITSAKWPPI